MARQEGKSIEVDFSRGLITEASPLAFPKNACTETFNCIFDGSTKRVKRRKGFDVEKSFTEATVSLANSQAFVEYVWESVYGDLKFLVQQQGPTLHFYDITTDSSVSANKKAYTVDLATFKPSGSGADPGVFQCSFAAGNGDLIVTNKVTDPFYVSYAQSNDTFTATRIVLKARDSEGVVSGLASSTTRPSYSSVSNFRVGNAAHYYNVLNQGWYLGGASGSLNTWINTLGVAPSDCDFPAMYRNSSTDNFDISTFSARTASNTPAPKGHFILNVGNEDRNAAITADGLIAASTASYTSYIAGNYGYKFAMPNAQNYEGATDYSTSTSSYIVPSSYTNVFQPSTISEFYAGKYFASGVRCNRIEVYPASVTIPGNLTLNGFYRNGTGDATSKTITIKLYGRFGSLAPGSSTDGVLLGTTTTTNNAAYQIVNSSDPNTFYNWIWTVISVNSPVFAIGTSEIYIQEVLTYTVPGTAGTISLTSTPERPTAVEFFSSRVFYAGIQESRLASNIYFSQIIESRDKYGLCYQQNDPTHPDFFDLLPNDGGVIKIPEMGKVMKMLAIQSSLFIFASNGIWRISGSSGRGFLATDFQVKRLTNLGMSSPMSVVNYRGLPLWWGEDGIFGLEYNPQFDSYSVESLTDKTISTFFNNIPSKNREYVKGAFDSSTDIIVWLYSTTTPFAEADYYKYNRILVWDGGSKAFYPWTLPNQSALPRIRGIFYLFDKNDTDKAILKYTTTYNNKLVYSDSTGNNYKDWVNLAGHLATPSIEVDYESYFISGYAVDGEGIRYFQPGYITVYSDVETNSSCNVQTIFDFTTTPNSAKWSNKQQTYSSNTNNASVCSRRLKIRGKGRALQLKFTSSSGKPFNLIGWSTTLSAHGSI